MSYINIYLGYNMSKQAKIFQLPNMHFNATIKILPGVLHCLLYLLKHQVRKDTASYGELLEAMINLVGLLGEN